MTPDLPIVSGQGVVKALRRIGFVNSARSLSDAAVTADQVPRLVVVAGAPGTGKTTLARLLAQQLRLPLLSKDSIKELLMEALGAPDRERSREIGAAPYEPPDLDVPTLTVDTSDGYQPTLQEIVAFIGTA